MLMPFLFKPVWNWRILDLATLYFRGVGLPLPNFSNLGSAYTNNQCEHWLLTTHNCPFLRSVPWADRSSLSQVTSPYPHDMPDSLWLAGIDTKSIPCSKGDCLKWLIIQGLQGTFQNCTTLPGTVSSLAFTILIHIPQPAPHRLLLCSVSTGNDVYSSPVSDSAPEELASDRITAQNTTIHVHLHVQSWQRVARGRPGHYLIQQASSQFSLMLPNCFKKENQLTQLFPLCHFSPPPELARHFKFCWQIVTESYPSCWVLFPFI